MWERLGKRLWVPFQEFIVAIFRTPHLASLVATPAIYFVEIHEMMILDIIIARR
jgi:hypothetical protein